MFTKIYLGKKCIYIYILNSRRHPCRHTLWSLGIYVFDRLNIIPNFKNIQNIYICHTRKHRYYNALIEKLTCLSLCSSYGNRGRHLRTLIQKCLQRPCPERDPGGMWGISISVTGILSPSQENLGSSSIPRVGCFTIQDTEGQTEGVAGHRPQRSQCGWGSRC